MRVQVAPGQALETLRTMPPAPKKAMRAALERLGKDPSGRTTGLDVRRLETEGRLVVYRLKVGEWRAGFLVGKDHVRVVQVFHRSEGYDWLGSLSSAIDKDPAAKRRS